MDAPCSTFSGARALSGAVLAGMAELALCRSRAAGLVIAACFLALSPRAGALALLGAAVATAWPFLRQRDIRLLNSGWYGVNGALCGFLVEWHFVHPVGAVVLTVLAAWAAALILDAIVLPLGDAPVGLPPLTLPFLAVAALITVWAQPLQRDMEWGGDGEEPLAAPWAAEAPEPEAQAAWAAYVAQDYRAARAAFLWLSDKSPRRAEAWNGLGWSEVRLGEFVPAAASFARALALDPAHPYALDGLGWLDLEAGRTDEAGARFRAAAAALPGWADPLVGRGWVAYGGGRHGEAGRLFRRALALSPLLPSAQGGLGWVGLRNGDFPAALALFDAALAGAPDLLSAREGRGRALLALGRPREAETEFLGLLGRSPAAIQGLADARRLLLLRGDIAAADGREWGALAGLVGWKGPVLAALAATVLVWTPMGGLIGLGLMGLGMAAAVALAGPASLLWVDLHVQTVAMLGLLLGRRRHWPGWPGLMAVLVLGVAVWAGMHRLGGWLPLISFNIAAVAALAAGGRLAFRSPSRGFIFSPRSADILLGRKGP